MFRQQNVFKNVPNLFMINAGIDLDRFGNREKKIRDVVE